MPSSQFQYEIILFFFSCIIMKGKTKANQTGKEMRMPAELTAAYRDTTGTS